MHEAVEHFMQARPQEVILYLSTARVGVDEIDNTSTRDGVDDSTTRVGVDDNDQNGRER